MKMGEIHKLYPTVNDSLDENLFFVFKKHYEEHKEDIFLTLMHHKQTIIITNTGEEILCVLQKFHENDFVTNPYGKEYHIFLESEDKRFGCHIEHRLRPVTGELRAQGLYPSSWMVNNRKTGRSKASLYREDESGEDQDAISLGEVNLA